MSTILTVREQAGLTIGGVVEVSRNPPLGEHLKTSLLACDAPQPIKRLLIRIVSPEATRRTRSTAAWVLAYKVNLGSVS